MSQHPGLFSQGFSLPSSPGVSLCACPGISLFPPALLCPSCWITEPPNLMFPPKNIMGMLMPCLGRPLWMCCSPSTFLTEEPDMDFYFSSHTSVTLLPSVLRPLQLLSDCQPPLASCFVLRTGFFCQNLSPYSFSSIPSSPGRVTAAHGHSPLLGLHHS